MKKFLILPVIVSASAMAATIGTCRPTTLSSRIGNPCALGEEIFDNFADSGNATTALSALVTGAGFFANLSSTDRNFVISWVSPNIHPANHEQSNFSVVPGSAGDLNNNASPDPTDNFVPDSETGGAQVVAATTTVTTVSTVTSLSGVDGANPGVADLELQADTALVPEPASFALIGAGLVCLGLLRKRFA